MEGWWMQWLIMDAVLTGVFLCGFQPSTIAS